MKGIMGCGRLERQGACSQVWSRAELWERSKAVMWVQVWAGRGRGGVVDRFCLLWSESEGHQLKVRQGACWDS